jgi:hypothetical protein
MDAVRSSSGFFFPFQEFLHPSCNLRTLLPGSPAKSIDNTPSEIHRHQASLRAAKPNTLISE